MNVTSLILLTNIIFFLSAIITQSIISALIISIAIFFILNYFISSHKIKIVETRINLRNIILANQSTDYTTAIFCLFVFLATQVFLGFNGAIFTSFFIFVHIKSLDSRSAFFMGTIFLILTLFLAVALDQKSAEITLITSYYFLLVGTLWRILEIKHENKSYINTGLFWTKNKTLTKIFLYAGVIFAACLTSYLTSRQFSPLIDAILSPRIMSPLPEKSMKLYTKPIKYEKNN